MNYHILPFAESDAKTRTPELNPIEQIWKEVRKDGFKNTLFATLSKVVDKLSSSLTTLSKNTVKSICGRDWI